MKKEWHLVRIKIPLLGHTMGKVSHTQKAVLKEGWHLVRVKVQLHGNIMGKGLTHTRRCPEKGMALGQV